MINPIPLSPASQAGLDAVVARLDLDAHYHGHEAAAAALRAAALYCPQERRILMTIADELDS